MARSQGTRGLVVLLLAAVALAGNLPYVFTGAPSTRGRIPETASAPRTAEYYGDMSETLQPSAQEEPSQFSPVRLGSFLVSLLAALVLAFAPVTEAQAAKSGGRIGGSAPSKRPPPPARAAPRPAAPTTAPRPAESTTVNKTTIINRTTVIAAPPPQVIVAPAPVYSPYGYGMMGAPIIVAPAPTLGDIIVGAAVSSAINSSIPRGPSSNDRVLENQMRQDERQMDKQSNQLEDLQRELAALKK